MRGRNDGGSLVIRVNLTDWEIKFCLVSRGPRQKAETSTSRPSSSKQRSNTFDKQFCVALEFKYHNVEDLV